MAAQHDLIADQLVSFCGELRGEGLAIGTAEILDAFAAVEQVPWTDRAQFREALATTLAKSQEDRHLFERVFDRWFFRAAELEAIGREGAAEGEAADRGPGEAGGDGERIDIDELTEMIRQAIADGDETRMRDLAQLAVAAFGRRGEGSGVVGVDVQRIRRTLGLTPGTRAPDGGAEDVEIDRDGVRRFESHLRRELERRLIEPPGNLPPERPLADLARAQPPNPPRDARQRAARPTPRPGRRRAADDARLAADRWRPVDAALPAEASPAPGDLRPL